MRIYNRQTNFTAEQLDYLAKKSYENDLHYYWGTFKLAVERGTFNGLLTRGEIRSLKKSGILKSRSPKTIWFTQDFLEKHGKDL